MRLVAFAMIAGAVVSVPEVSLADDPSRINGHVLPYYDSTAPIAKVGAYSGGLASPSQSAFVSQYKGRQFALLVDRRKLGGVGDSAFELYQAESAFFELAGGEINGYAFGDVSSVAAEFANGSSGPLPGGRK